jgi:hypothetical protein
MRKEVPIEDGGGTRGSALWALLEDMVLGSAEHTAREPDWVATFEVSGRVHGIDGRSILGALGLVSAHGLLSWGQEDTSEVGLFIWVYSRGRDYHEGVVGGVRGVLELF